MRLLNQRRSCRASCIAPLLIYSEAYDTNTHTAPVHPAHPPSPASTRYAFRRPFRAALPPAPSFCRHSLQYQCSGSCACP